jgi:hypothetical protein
MYSVVISVMLTFAVFGFSQTVDTTSESSSVQAGLVIDGSISPEKIPDADAYRLFLVTVSEPADASQEQQDQQLAFLKHIDLGTADLDSAIRILTAFRRAV